LFIAMSTAWADWPPNQHDAITAYLTALWQATIGGYWLPSKLDVVDLLEAAGDLEVPLDSYLRAWETDRGEPAALHLAWLIRHSSPWRGNLAAEWSLALGQWMREPTPRRVLAAAVMAAGTPEVAANLSGALDILNSWGQAA
ncbi:MAG TPA: hypothetical protein VGK33_18480, partial [Chloroflexota bacterium]